MVEHMYQPVQTEASDEMKQCFKDIAKYEKYKYNLKLAKGKCEEAINGMDLLIDTQYNEVGIKCIFALNKQENLLEALKVKKTNMRDAVRGMLEEINDGISKIDSKLEELNTLKNTLKN